MKQLVDCLAAGISSFLSIRRTCFTAKRYSKKIVIDVMVLKG